MAGKSFNQRTLKRPIALDGVGLHSGAPVRLQLMPAREDHGIVFTRVDLPGRPQLPARCEFVVDTSLATTLGLGPASPVKVATVEHLLAALAGLGIDNLRIEVNGPEVPIMDGSAEPFAAAVLEAGIRVQEAPKSMLVIRKPVMVRDGDKRAALVPSKRFQIDCTIDFEHPLIADQRMKVEFSDHTFAKEVAKARTFGFLRDVEKLKSMGLARGGSLDNAIVVDEFSILNPEGLRFPDEFVRHKLLDALGDVSLLGAPVLGHLSVFKSGHALNHQLVKKVLADPSNYELVPARARDVAELDLAMADLKGMLAPTAA
jgi:UDP-3-O-[3-hydroxymyristoyl] N-acetylglucosamine deacetylase